MYGLTNQDLDMIINVLKQYPQIEICLIFGSRALGTHQHGSDVDLVIKGKQLQSLVGDISAILNERSTLPYFFDILDYDSIEHEPLKNHIDRVGKVLYTNQK